MNFLAHIYLTMPDEELTIGNFVGDFVKGTQYRDFPSQLQKGILLHRKIDHYTDLHHVVKRSKGRLWTKYRHYAGVIVDMFYDHLLAKNWSDFSKEPLLDFSESFYQTTDKFMDLMPERAKYMLTYMKRDNWLYHYQFMTGLNQALTGMSKRTPFDSGMETASAELDEMYDAFLEDFRQFFPDLVAFAREQIDSDQ